MDPLFRAAIGLPPPLHLEESPSMALDVPASFVAMKAAATENSPTRDDDSESVYYINTIPSIPQAEAALAKLEEDNQFTCSYWSAKAIEAADLKIDKKELPTGDDIDAKTKRANYRIRVIEHAMNSSTWLSSHGVASTHRHFTVAKKELHATIITTLLEGLLLPKKVEGDFEKILTSISAGLKDTEAYDGEQLKWLSITTYRYDTRMKKVFAGFRTIFFKVTQSIKNANKSKHDTSQLADLVLDYQQQDWRFNEDVWEGVEGAVKEYLKKTSIIIKPIDIPV